MEGGHRNGKWGGGEGGGGGGGGGATFLSLYSSITFTACVSEK